MTDQIAPDIDPDTLPAALVELRQARAEIGRLRPFVDMADQAARAAERMRTVQGRCPACRWTTLFLGDGGHVTCSRLDCPRPDLVNELIGDIADARTHRGYTFCSQLVGHVNMTAFAKKSTEKITAVAQRAEAVAYANEQKQRAEQLTALALNILDAFEAYWSRSDYCGPGSSAVQPEHFEGWRTALTEPKEG